MKSHQHFNRRRFFKLGGWAILATFTPNYNLRKPEDSDDVDVDTDLGTNYDTIDAALGAFSNTFQLKIKDVDTARNTTIVLADDPALKGLVLEAGGVYELDGLLAVVSASNVPDFKGSVVLNGVATIDPSLLSIEGLELAVTNVASALVSNACFAVSNPGSYAGNFARGVSTTVSGIRLKGLIRPTDSGFLDFQWCQSVSDASDVTLKAGSYLKLTRLV